MHPRTPHPPLPGLLLGLLVLLLGSTAPLAAAAQSVVEVVFDGLPAEVTAEALGATMTLKQGAVYDKALLPADRQRLVGLLKDLGFLDAEARTTITFIPAGVRLTVAIKARNRYTVEKVEAEGVPPDALAAILLAARVDQQALCTQAVVDQLALALAPRMGINVLYLEAERRPNANKKEAALIFRR